MEKMQYRIRGHESFILRDGWLSKGINAVIKNPKVFQENSGADAIGVGTNMAKAIRYWLKAARLMTENSTNGAKLTDIGEMLANKDPYFEDIFSLWAVHSEIASNFELATSWSVFFNNTAVSSFTREDLIKVMTHALGDVIPENIPERSIKDDCSAIISMYAPAQENDDPEEKKGSPFSELGLIRLKNGLYEKSRPAMDSVSPYLVLYIMADALNENGSIPIDTIAEGKNMPGKLLNLNRVSINDYLDSLQAKKYITINRTCGLDTVYAEKKLKKTDILKSYYKGA